jgi:hypothetical protein
MDSLSVTSLFFCKINQAAAPIAAAAAGDFADFSQMHGKNLQSG